MSARELSVFVHDLSIADLPTHVIEQGQRCVLDLLGTGAVGAGTPLSRLACEHAARHFGAVGVGARMLFDGRRVSPVGAALAGE
ncbi:MAG: MmgE/PrpD family protein [Nocardioidaceae bacterium]